MTLSSITQDIQNIIKNNPSPDTIPNIEHFYQQLIDCIIDHNHRYYNQNNPLISDKEYDELFSYLKKIEETFPHLISSTSPTQNLIGQLEIQTDFKKAEHIFPLKSLENSYSIEDIINWGERTQRIFDKYQNETETKLSTPEYLLEPKFDGIAIALTYKDGILVQAITRGDGIWGEDVTENAKTIESIPQKLTGEYPQGTIVFRGEIVISKTMLNTINKDRIALGENIYANTRNLAAGSIKQLDPNITAQRKLIAFMYEAYGFSNAHNLYSLKEYGFNGKLDSLDFFSYKSYSLEEINSAIQFFSENTQQQKIHDSDIEFDGLVIKIKDAKMREILGSTAHHPRRAIAYKFPAQQVATQIVSVDFQVGRTGIITPVANLDPVKLSGATLSRVSLHNFDIINEKDIHIKDYIWLQRSGEVIPYIVGVIKERMPAEATKIIPPDTCPSCHSKVSKEDMHYYCRNDICPAQLEQRLIWFVSKNAMNIEGVGESIAKILVEQKIVQDVFDIYKLLDPQTVFIVRRFPGFADKKISEIQKQLQASKYIPLWRLLNALGIGGIGKKTAQDIQEYLEQLPNYENTWEYISQKLQDKEYVENIYGIGEKIINNIVEYFNTHTELQSTIKRIGIQIQEKKTDMPQKETDKGHFSITGTFPISRPQIIKYLEKSGYIFDTSPKKTTDYMLIGEKAGSKQAKAEELGLKILDTREKITQKFPELGKLDSKESKIKPNSGPIQGGLFI